MSFTRFNWRDTGRQLRFLGFMDGRAAFLLVIMIYHVSWWTFGMAVVGITALIILEKRGYTLPNAFRRLRVLMSGSIKHSDTSTRQSKIDR